MADDDQDYDDGLFYEDDYLYVEDSVAPEVQNLRNC